MRSLVCLLVVVLGCGKSTEPAMIRGSWSPPPLLAHVPDESPYVFAALEPMRETLAVLRSAEGPVAEALAAFDALDPSLRGELPPQIRALYVLFEELRGKRVEDWWPALGLSTDNNFVLYGYSVWPVMRLVIANPERVRSLLERMAKAAGLVVPAVRHANGTYWVYRYKAAAIIVAIDDRRRQLIATVVHDHVEKEMIAHVFGAPPPVNLATTRRVPDMLAKHSLSLLAFGYLDSVQLFAAYDRPVRPIDRPWRTLIPDASRACRADLARFRDAMPRMIFAYRKIEGQLFDMSAIVEVPASVTSALARMQTSVPALPAYRVRPVFAVGAAIDSDQLLAWLRDVAKTWLGRSERCEWFSFVDQAFARVATSLDDPKFSLYGLRGGTFVIEDLDLQAQPIQAVGDVLLVGDRVHELPALLGPLLPPQASVPIAAEGRPIAVPLAHLNIPWSVHLGRRGDRLALAVGPDSERRVSARLEAPAVKAPLLSFIADYEKFEALGLDDDDEDANAEEGEEDDENDDDKPSKFEWIEVRLEVRDGALDFVSTGEWRD